MLLLYCRITVDFSLILAAKAGTSNCKHERKVLENSFLKIIIKEDCLKYFIDEKIYED